MRSLEEWNKHVDEQEEAVKRIQKSCERELDTDEWEESASLTEATVSDETDTDSDITSDEGDVAVRPISDLTRLRKHLPEKIFESEDGESEVAQRSYRTFKETREELLQRLLDPQISLEDAARILNVCPTTVRRYTNRGLLKHYRTPGNQRRFRLSDVLALLERQSNGEDIVEA